MAISFFYPHRAKGDYNITSTASENYGDNFISEKYIPYQRYTSNSCVLFAREYTGLDFKGNAWELKPSSEPYVGGWVLTKEGPGHVAVITSIVGDNLYLIEANYVPNTVTTRTILKTDSRIRGFK